MDLEQIPFMLDPPSVDALRPYADDEEVRIAEREPGSSGPSSAARSYCVTLHHLTSWRRTPAAPGALLCPAPSYLRPRIRHDDIEGYAAGSARLVRLRAATGEVVGTATITCVPPVFVEQAGPHYEVAIAHTSLRLGDEVTVLLVRAPAEATDA